MKQKQTKQKRTQREYFDGYQMGGVLRRLVKREKGLKSANVLLPSSHGDGGYTAEGI